MTCTSQVRWTALPMVALPMVTLPPAALAFSAIPPGPRSCRMCLPRTWSSTARAQGASPPVPSQLSPGGPGRSWSSSAGFGSSLPLHESQETLQSNEAKPGGMVPGGCEPGPATALGQQHAGQGLRAHMETWAGTKAPLPPLQPFAQPQEAEVSLSCCRGNKDRLTDKGNKTEPA